LYWGPHHPDGILLTDGNVNLLGFLYDPQYRRPQVVIWLADEAGKEYWRWEAALKASGWNEDEPVRYEDFTVPVAPRFDAFLSLLRDKP
jgi:hypothetical protein